eukprot:scpid79957/ scgid22510/ 
MASGNDATDEVQVTRASYGSKIERHCLLVGQTGCGKSTIINMMINNGCSERDCEGPNTIGHEATAGKTKFKFSVIPSRDWLLCDSIGFGDLDNKSKRLLDALQGIYNSARMGVSGIVFVVRGPQFTREDKSYLEILAKLFGDEWAESAILVITGHHRGFETGESAWKRWCAGREDLLAIGLKFRSVIFTDNDWRNPAETCKTGMKDFLEHLIQCIEKEDRYIVIKPTSFRHVLQVIMRKLQESLKYDPRPLLKTLERSLKPSETDALDPGYCGECSRCGEEVFLRDLVITPCRHCFHRTCISTSRGHAPKCTCGESVTVLYDAMV